MQFNRFDELKTKKLTIVNVRKMWIYVEGILVGISLVFTEREKGYICNGEIGAS